MSKNYWLMKSEPDVWSIAQQKKAGKKGVAWDGVRNYQARNNLKEMKKGDLCFFYHSNIGKEIVGIVKVIKRAFIDKTDKIKFLNLNYNEVKSNIIEIRYVGEIDKNRLILTHAKGREEYNYSYLSSKKQLNKELEKFAKKGSHK